MFNLEEFDLGEMTRFGAALRRLGGGADSMEQAAAEATRYIHEMLTDERGEPACALVRLFKTQLWADLPEHVRMCACQAPSGPAAVRCLVLLGSAGIEPAWRSPRTSAAHQCIPLTSPESVRAAPMIAGLVSQLGLDLARVVEPSPGLFLDQHSALFGVFHVPDAAGSALVPAQEHFVIPYGVSSVLGFGGALHDGEIFAVILFSKVKIPVETAKLFAPLSLNVRLSLAPHERRIFH